MHVSQPRPPVGFAREGQLALYAVTFLPKPNEQTAAKNFAPWLPCHIGNKVLVFRT